MTNEERIVALQSYGYSHRQATFLCTVAVHSGYFLRRQYHKFLGQKPGASAERLIQRGLANGHIRIHGSANRTLIYHLGSRSVYEVLADEDNPNQRWRQPSSIKTKLMSLDFVLAHPQHRYLATEEEKLDFFCSTLGVKRDCLFARSYGSRHSEGEARTRYFADRFPIFVTNAAAELRPVVSFCYVDGGRVKPSGFETYIEHYRPVFSSLSSFEMVYVAIDPQMFPKAERAFARCFRASLCNPKDPLLARLREHFRIRELFERRGSRCLDQQSLDSFRDELDEYSGPQFDTLYKQWKDEGRPGVGADAATDQVRRVFRTWRVADEYQLFGDLTSRDRGVRHHEPRTAGTRPLVLC
jgi:hypothetical protein